MISALMPFYMSLKDLKINRILKDAGIPEEKRKQWPILRLGDQIIGIPGVCLNKKFAPRMEKALYLRITFFPC